MTDSTGFNGAAAEAAIQNVIDGGATVHLCTTAVDYDDDSAALDGKSDATESVAEADFTISQGASFSDVATLQNDVEIDFGSQDIGTVVDVAIQNDADGDVFIVADEVNDPELTGENYSIAADSTLYELGNPT